MSGTPQRRSTRATKEPERLAATSTPLTPRKRGKAAAAPSAFASPVVSSPSSKRQRVVSGKAKRRTKEDSSDEEQVEEEEDDVEEEDEEEDELSEFEESARIAPKKKAASKAQPQKQQVRKTTARLKKAAGSTDSPGFESQLLEAVTDEKAALSQVVSDWIGSYRASSDLATCELLNFLIKLTGASPPPTAIISPATLYDDAAETMEALQAQSIAALKRGASGTSEDDLLMGKSKEHRRVRKSVLQFLSKLIGDGQHYLLFAEINEESRLSPFIEVLLQWLVGMAGSSFRPFRHVATLVALSVQTAVAGIRARISSELQTTHRQLEAKGSRGGRQAQQQLRDRVAQLSLQDEAAEAAFKAFYDTVFIYRYRDVQATIRSECVVPLATWCRVFPAAYLDTEFLRYLGWALNDKDARVRETALAAIGGPLLLGKQPTHGGVGSGVGGGGGALASEESVAEGIRPFIGRFLPRIVQMAAGDIDVKVQVAALKLVAQLGKHQFLDSAAKVGDIRSIKPKTEKKKKGKGASRKNKKKTASSRGTYSHTLSQQLLQESSSEEEEEVEEEVEGNEDGEGVIEIQMLYDDESPPFEAGRMECPRHTTMRYLAPLVAHTQAAVRAAAAELVAWWLREDWMSQAQPSQGEEMEGDDDVDKWAAFKA
ncbi:cohesin complex subunit, partial [Coemansia aciculifera]